MRKQADYDEMQKLYADFAARGGKPRKIAKSVRGYSNTELRALENGSKTLAEIHAARPDPDALA